MKMTWQILALSGLLCILLTALGLLAIRVGKLDERDEWREWCRKQGIKGLR